MPLVARPVAGGLMVGAIALVFPEVLGVGYEATDAALKGQLPIILMLALLIAKTAATAITLASRFGGGVFSPSLYLGAMTGGAFGLIAAAAFPEMASSDGLYAILGMGAVTAVVLGAPISTVVMVFELTGGFALSLALLLTVAIAHGIGLAVLGRSWFHAQLEQRGVVIRDGPHKVMVSAIRVAGFMEPVAADAAPDLKEGAPVLHATDTLEAALRLFDTSGIGHIAVVALDDPRKVVGMASQIDALTCFNKALIASSVEEHR
jgi:CIC family chloride channel protein